MLTLHAIAPIAQAQNRFRSNGERIYYTGTNDDGISVPYEEGPKWFQRRKIGCVACHGENGKGGYLIWPSLKMAPDVRYDSLVKKEHVHGDRIEIHPRYTDDLIRRALTEGINAAGESLDIVMPRWKLTDRDFADLIDYLRQLSAGIEPPPELFPPEEEGRR